MLTLAERLVDANRQRARVLARSLLRRLFERQVVWAEVRPYKRPKLQFGAIPVEPLVHVTARGYDPLFAGLQRSLVDSVERSSELLSRLAAYGGESSERTVAHDPYGAEVAAPIAAAEDFRKIRTGLSSGQETRPDVLEFNTHRFLYFLMRELRPDRVLELGTAHGLSGLHIIGGLEANRRGHLTTLELDATRRALAIRAFQRFFPGSTRWTSVEASFSEALPSLAEDLAPIDVIFEDGPHTGEQTLQAFQRTVACLKPGGLYVVDDIAFDRGQENAWVAIRNDPRIEASVEVNARFGLCVRATRPAADGA